MHPPEPESEPADAAAHDKEDGEAATPVMTLAEQDALRRKLQDKFH